MSKNRQPKYKGKQCITWLDSDGARHRTRFLKGTSVFVIDAKLAAKQANLSCYDTKIMSKDEWVRKFGDLNGPSSKPTKYIDPKFLEPDYEMKKWKQENRNYYYNSVF